MKKPKIIIGALAVVLLVGGGFFVYTEWIGSGSDASKSDNIHTTFTPSCSGDPTIVSYEIDTLWVGATPLFLPGYDVRNTGTVIVGWRQGTPGIEISSRNRPFEDPVVSAVVFHPREPAAADPERLLLIAHENRGLLQAPEASSGKFEGSNGRESWYSVVEGPMDTNPDIISVSGAIIAAGGDFPAVGVNMVGADREAIEQSIAEIAEVLAS